LAITGVTSGPTFFIRCHVTMTLLPAFEQALNALRRSQYQFMAYALLNTLLSLEKNYHARQL